MTIVKDPVSGLLLPRQFVDEKQSLKKVIDELVEKSINANQNIQQSYFLTINAKFDRLDPSQFKISSPVASFKLPPFVSNSFVFWINNARGLCELLWIVPAKKPGEKLKVEFNKSSVAYLQAKGAMPS